MLALSGIARSCIKYTCCTQRRRRMTLYIYTVSHGSPLAQLREHKSANYVAIAGIARVSNAAGISPAAVFLLCTARRNFAIASRPARSSSSRGVYMYKVAITGGSQFEATNPASFFFAQIRARDCFDCLIKRHRSGLSDTVSSFFGGRACISLRALR